MYRRGPERKACFVLECKNNEKTAPNKKFFKIPMSDPKRRNAWFVRCRKEAAYFSKTFAPFICEDHFDLREDLENYLAYSMMGQRPRFKPDVVPHKFECCRGEVTGSKGTRSRSSRAGTEGESSSAREVLPTACEVPPMLELESCDPASLCSAEIKEEVMEMEEDVNEKDALDDEESSSQNQVWLSSVKIEPDEENVDSFQPLNSECSSSNVDQEIAETAFVKLEPAENMEGEDNFMTGEDEEADVTDDYDLIDYTHSDYIEGSSANSSNEASTTKKSRRNAVKKLHECYICQKFCTDINRHLLIHSGERQHICQICKKPFKRLDYLRNHLINVHRIIWVGKTKQMMSIGLIAHVAQAESEKATIIPMQQVTPEITSTSVQPKISNNETRSFPQIAKKGNYKCPKCPKEYKFLVHLNKHLILHSNKKKLFKCDICKKDFVYREYLTQHIEKHLEAQIPPSEKRKSTIAAGVETPPAQQFAGQINGQNVTITLTARKDDPPTSSTGYVSQAMKLTDQAKVVGQYVLPETGEISQLESTSQSCIATDQPIKQEKSDDLDTPSENFIPDVPSSDDDTSEDMSDDHTIFYRETYMNRALLYQCKLCFQKSQSKESIKKHLEIVHPENNTTGILCHHCNLCFENRISLLNHITVLHQDNPYVHIPNIHIQYYYRCKFCLCCFVNLILFEDHYENLHLKYVNKNVDFTDDNQTYSCIKIASQFNPSGGTVMTLKIGRSMDEFDSESSGNLSNETSKNKLENVSRFKSITPKKRESHLRFFICHICNVKLGSKKLLDHHIKLHETPINTELLLTSNAVDQSSFHCKICDQYYACKEELTLHLTDHKKRYVCKICGVEYKSMITLTRHLKEIHRKICKKIDKPSPLRCKVCFKKCADVASLKDHENVHTGAQPHQCHVCSISFSLAETLKSHLQMVHMI